MGRTNYLETWLPQGELPAGWSPKLPTGVVTIVRILVQIRVQEAGIVDPEAGLASDLGHELWGERHWVRDR